MDPPSGLISYSHDSETRKGWVRKLAEDLRTGGVDAKLDQWDLRHGADVAAFMEAGIRSADRVLMLCSGNYVAKAEERKGGAGYEGMIVTSHVARSTATIKWPAVALPSEAQWEYSCRVGGTKPFHFGATLTPDLAHYRAAVPGTRARSSADRLAAPHFSGLTFSHPCAGLHAHPAPHAPAHAGAVLRGVRRQPGGSA